MISRDRLLDFAFPLLVVRSWLAGWRRNSAGWLVRARLSNDPDLSEIGRTDVGFTECHCIAVRNHEFAMRIDHGWTPEVRVESTLMRILREIDFDHNVHDAARDMWDCVTSNKRLVQHAREWS